MSPRAGLLMLRVGSLLAVLLGTLSASTGVGPPEPPEVPPALGTDGGVTPWIPRNWLVLPAVDRRGRRPFNPDAVVARYVLADPGLTDPRGLPAEGDVVVGETGEPGTWTARQADDKGNLDGPVGTAVTTVQAETDVVVLADLSGASRLWVNDVPHHGDVYRAGFGPVPVRLRAGENRLIVSGVRGRFRLQLHRPAAEILLPESDDTRPQLPAGQPIDTWAGVLVVNATDRWQHLPVTVGDGVVFERLDSELTLPPLGTTKLSVRLRGVAGQAPGDGLTDLVCPIRCGPALRSLALHVVDATGVHTSTFVSAMDHSVQKYSLVPPMADEGGGSSTPAEQHLVLSLHGAGVDCPSQARSYQAKPDFWIFAPTNRRPFGFDWQDWGRRDAYEVLEHGLARSGVSRTRVSLTGHSMGGHGTWHLGANDADGFAALGPSAGWIGFDTYGGRPDGSLAPVWHAADGASLTLDLLDNLVPQPIYILHGADDDNVPATEARRMHEVLTEAGAHPGIHIEPDRNHWWGEADPPRPGGADCVDWPEMFELFRASEIETDPDQIAFATVDPGVDSAHHWVTVVQPLVYGEPSRVQADRGADGVVRLTTENVRRLEVAPGVRASTWVVDDERFEAEDGATLAVYEDGTVTTSSRAGKPGWQLQWTRASPSDPLRPAAQKSPRSSGPFKRVFDRGFLLVVGTSGDDDEDRAALGVARYHAQTWWYRGNGHARVLTDREFLADPAEVHAEAHVVLYGNADSNAAWSRVLGRDGPVGVSRGRVTLGEESWEGDELAVLVVRPRADVGGADPPLVGLVAGTGARGLLLAATVPVFVSGVGLPDVTVFGPDVLTAGDEGVLAAGWFDHAWRVPPGGF